METMYDKIMAGIEPAQSINSQGETTTVKINAMDVTDGSRSFKDMWKIYEAVKTPLEQNKKVVLSFKGMGDVAPGQLSLSVDKLYDDFLPEKIEQLLVMTDYPKHRNTDIALVYKMGRLYRYNRPEYDRIQQKCHEISLGDY
jgi:hypothetical protein